MSNNYFKIEKAVETKGFDKYPGYVNNYTLSLTAFMGNEQSGNVQLTIHTSSTVSRQSGVAYITLNSEEIDKLIFGLLERKLKLISATGDEQSRICPNEELNINDNT